MALENMIVGRPLRAMFAHKVRELGVLRLLSIRVEVVTDLVQCSPGWSLSCVLHTKADGYVATTSGRVYLATTSY